MTNLYPKNALDTFFDHAQQADMPTNAVQFNPNPVEDASEQIELTIDTLDDQQRNAEDGVGFDALGLAPVLLKSIEATGYTTPTPIQAQAIPAALNGRDLLLSAQTGSGKTAAFVLPILHTIHHTSKDSKARQSKAVKALILTPTRELAHQVGDSIRKYGASMRDLFSVPLVGGAAYSGQIRALKKGVQIIVATPGRLLDHINAGRVNLSALEILVLDEADRMLDMGFADDIEAILKATPATRQTIMSSATWDGPVGKIAESFTENPERINIKVETAHIDESVYFCDNFDHKNKLLESLICDQDRGQAIIFTATKRSSEELAERLQEWGHKACYLHGDLPQSKRNRIVADLRSGKHDIVVATDVAARGIDLPNITHVFNYDLPRQVEDYVHRIGRSGRAGRTGIAVNLCSRDDRRQFGNIMRYLKRDIQASTVEGLEPRFVEKFEDRRRGRDGKRNGGEQRGRGRNGERRLDSRYDGRFDSRSDSRSRPARFSESNEARTERDGEFKPRRHREALGDSRSFNSDKPRFEGRSQDDRFERAAKISDRPYTDKPRGEKSERFNDKTHFSKKTDGFNSNRFGDERFGNDKSRKPRGVSEQTFGKDSNKEFDTSKPRSEKNFDKPFKANTDKSEKFGKSKTKRFDSDKPRSDKPRSDKPRSDKPRSAKARFTNANGKMDSAKDGWHAPKRARRNSTGKPL